MTKTLAQANLPNVKLKVDSFSLSVSPHKHSATVYWGDGGTDDHVNSSTFSTRLNGNAKTNTAYTNDAGGGTTGTATPSTQSLGSGQALDITPAYYTCHMWLRLT